MSSSCAAFGYKLAGAIWAVLAVGAVCAVWVVWALLAVRAVLAVLVVLVVLAMLAVLAVLAVWAVLAVRMLWAAACDCFGVGLCSARFVRFELFGLLGAIAVDI